MTTTIHTHLERHHRGVGANTGRSRRATMSSPSTCRPAARIIAPSIPVPRGHYRL